MTLDRRSLYILPLLAVACRDGPEWPELPPIVWEGENLRFGTDEDLDTVCAGTLPFADAYAGYLGEVFDISDPQVDFYWLPDGLVEPCEPSWPGCSFWSRAYSREVLLQHEIVHAVRGDPHAVDPLEEGLAELFGDDWEPTYPLTGSAAAMFGMYDGGSSLPRPWYPLAGHFLSYLRAAHGDERLLALVAGSRREDSWERTQALFEDVHGFPIDDAVADYDTYPACDQTWYRDNGFECGQPAFALASEPDARTEVTVAMGCDEDSVIGPRVGERWTTIVLELDQGGPYLFDFDKVGGHSDGRLRVRECGQSCFVRDAAEAFVLDLQVESQPEPPDPELLIDGIVCIPAGRYVVRLAVDEDDDGEFVLRLLRADGEIPCAG